MPRQIKEFCVRCKQYFWADFEEQPDCPNGCDERDEDEEIDLDPPEPEDDEPDGDEAADFGGMELRA